MTKYQHTLFLGSIVLASQLLYAQPISKTVSKTTDKMIIKYKNNATLTNASISSTLQNITLRGSKRVQMSAIRKNGLQANILEVHINGKKPSLKEMKELAKKLSKQTDIEYAEPDYMLQIMQVPNDTFYQSKHWHLQNTPGGANLEGAWDTTTGSASDVIAVIDTGIIYHADLAGKILPGYDFIADTDISNDGDGRDSDPSDPGDNTDPSATYGSSWHGTHVAGTIAALSNNGEGITGINWNGQVLPIRVLGVGGGYISDITDGMLWAAGISVNGIPDNPNPAKVLNLSLGSDYSCSSTEQNAIDAINNIGAIVVVAAGNSDADASRFSPASCNGVITVAAAARDGGRASYSNYGNTVEITAPGGDEDEDSMIYSTLDGGFTSPVNDDAYVAYQGTSMATPHVAGITSLITSLVPNADFTQVLNILQSTVKPFPTGTGNDCTTSLCGTGLVDATAAITLASDPNAFAPHYKDSIVEGQTTLYTYDDPSDQVDPSSLWSIRSAKLTSNDIDDDQETAYRINIPGHIFDIAFDYIINAEKDYDGLRFSSEGSIVFDDLTSTNSGSYQQYNITTDGELNLEWVYHKDGSVSDGSDNTSIDNVSITSYQVTNYNFLEDESVKKVLQITNNGLNDLTISNISLSNTIDFDMSNTCTTPLGNSESCTIEVTYISAYNPSHTTTLTYNTNDTNHPTITRVFNVGNTSMVPIINYLLF